MREATRVFDKVLQILMEQLVRLYEKDYVYQLAYYLVVYLFIVIFDAVVAVNVPCVIVNSRSERLRVDVLSVSETLVKLTLGFYSLERITFQV